jgi:PAS domain S-box-containing protein
MSDEGNTTDPTTVMSALQWQRSLIEDSPLPIDAVDLELNVLVWNAAAEELFGWSRDEVIGRPVPNIPEENRRQMLMVHEATFRGETFAAIDTRRLRRDGSVLDISFSTVPLYDNAGEIRGDLAIMIDITERKRAEEAIAFLSRIGSQLSAALEVEPIVESIARLAVPALADFVTVDLLGGARGVRRVIARHADPALSDLAKAFLRYPSAPDHAGIAVSEPTTKPELVPDVSDGWLVDHAEDVEHLLLLRRLAPRSIITVPLVARDHTFGTITLVLTQAARRYTIKELDLADELGRRGAVAIDNARLYEETQQAVRARNEVLAIVSHDLRNPLNTVAMSAQVLLERLPAEQDEEGHHLLEIIRRSADRMNRLIRDLLDVARLEAGPLTIQPTPQDMATLIREVVELQEPLAHEKQIELTARLPEQIPTLEADKGRLLQVFQNLIDNALKFTPEGGTVTISAKPLEREVHFQVHDSGPGVPADALRHIFDPYWQAEGKPKEGAGLGLAIARGIVEAHGGRIWAESSPGKGTTIYFTLPLRERTPAGGATASE